MINYEEALKIAKEHKPNIDHCYEETLAWIFTSKEDEHTIGGDNPVVVLKETGDALNMPDYAFEYFGAKEIGDWEL